MTAKEMFEELEFKQVETHIFELIRYVYEDKYDKELNLVVSFTETEKVELSLGEEVGVAIDVPLLKAINKQCEELGWLEEERNWGLI